MFKTSGTKEASFDRMEVGRCVQVCRRGSKLASRGLGVAFLRAADTFRFLAGRCVCVCSLFREADGDL